MGGLGRSTEWGLTEVAKGRAGIFRALRPRPAGCGAAANNDVLPPLLGAAKARLGASSSRMRQWVES